jgi:hypothetical protein
MVWVDCRSGLFTGLGIGELKPWNQKKGYGEQELLRRAPLSSRSSSSNHLSESLMESSYDELHWHWWDTA